MQLILEHAPHAQQETAKTYSGGQFVIGRNDDCDWQLDDPERYVSRRHCTITDESGEVSIIDSSTDGLFVDGASHPLGTGNSVPLEHQMRLRVGDFVIRVEMNSTEAKEDISPSKLKHSEYDFGPADAPAYERPERPDDLPRKFGTERQEQTQRMERTKNQKPRGSYDPFALDLKRETPAGQDIPKDLEETTTPSGRSYFDTSTTSEKRSKPNLDIKKTPPDQKAVEKETGPTEGPWPPIEVTEDFEGAEPTLSEDSAKLPVTTQADETLAALVRGLGVEHKMTSGMTLAEIEAVGARFRDMVDGVMFLLRTRAQEKQKVRVAQTLIANADVNPLKFLASSDEAIVALIKGRDTSYLQGDKAVPGAFRDLADHQVRTWSALQTALRRMIDRFDPEEVERDMDDTGLLETLVAGGRSAKMWQLYQERYRDIAEAAEEKFLGEVGSDFRDAYETERT